MSGCDVLQQATAVASAKEAAVHVSFASSRLKLWLSPTVFAITPDQAMALSIELQKAAIDARQCDYRRTA
jgi:hypothetical protein